MRQAGGVEGRAGCQRAHMWHDLGDRPVWGPCYPLCPVLSRNKPPKGCTTRRAGAWLESGGLAPSPAPSVGPGKG